jgi:phage terminase large subunit GpA-like protein
LTPSLPAPPTSLFSAAQLYSRSATLIRPAKRLPAHQWGAKNRIYPASAGRPGPRDPLLTPYVIPFEDAAESGLRRRVIWVTAAQTAKTEGILDLLGSRVDQRPAPVLYVGPTKDFLVDQFEPRLMAMLDEAQSLAAKLQRGRRAKKTLKWIGGVPVRLAHAGSSTALKSDPAALALIDELESMLRAIKDQGDPLGLVEARGVTYADFCTVVTSTPGQGIVEIERDELSGLEFWAVVDPEDVPSPIWRLWQEGTRHHWVWPCPACGEYFVPRFKLLHWPEKATPVEALHKAWLVCPRCGGVIEDGRQEELNARGAAVAPGQRITPDGEIIGEPAENSTWSLWTSGLVSPFASFGKRAETYLLAINSGEQAQIQTAINAGFGECYLPGGGDLPDWEELKHRLRAPYKLRTVPEGVAVITAGVDVQGDRLVVVARGWGARGRSWLVDRTEIFGATAEVQVWDQLAEYLRDPIEGLPIKLAYIDSGFRPGEKAALPVHRVYEFCRIHSRFAFATKGWPKAAVPLRTAKIEVKRSDGKGAKYGLELQHLDSDHWKSWVHEHLQYPAESPMAWLLDADVDERYLRQVLSEVRVRKKSGGFEWVKRQRDNHFLDAEALAAAAGYRLGVQRYTETRVQSATKRRPGATKPPKAAASNHPQATTPSAAPPPAPAASNTRDRFAALSAKANR